MRYLVLLCLILLTACAAQALSGDNSLYSNDTAATLNYGNDTEAMLNFAASERQTIEFHAENFPPQCNPASWFPDGKVPADFMTNYDRPERQRFDACTTANAKAHAKGKEILFYMPESDLKTECSAGAQYPDGKVKPGFYGYPEPPEYDRYVECLIAEAHRDGDRVRLASPLSFPKVGACYDARVTDVGFGGGDGNRRNGSTAVSFDNGLSLFSYEFVPETEHLRTGDRVRQCVRDLPQDCPSHDLRGIDYRVTNLRTGERFVMPDTQHMCRGA